MKHSLLFSIVLCSLVFVSVGSTNSYAVMAQGDQVSCNEESDSSSDRCKEKCRDELVDTCSARCKPKGFSISDIDVTVTPDHHHNWPSINDTDYNCTGSATCKCEKDKSGSSLSADDVSSVEPLSIDAEDIISNILP